MYEYKARVELNDDLVHAYSIREWEEIFSAEGLIDTEDLPLSYAKVAELLALEVIAGSEIFLSLYAKGSGNEPTFSSDVDYYQTDKGPARSLQVKPVVDPGTTTGVHPGATADWVMVEPDACFRPDCNFHEVRHVHKVADSAEKAALDPGEKAVRALEHSMRLAMQDPEEQERWRPGRPIF